MTLRFRLALALMVATVLPMMVVVGVPILRAEGRARREAVNRLELTHRQASSLIARHKGDAASRVERAAWELGHDRRSLESVLGGPEEAAQEVARSLAERHGLDQLDILSAAGRVLSTSRADVTAGARSSLADVSENSIAIRPVPTAPGGNPQVAFCVRQPLPYAREPVFLVGARAIDRELIRWIAEITGEPTALLDASGTAIESAGEPRAGDRVTREIPLGEGGFHIQVSTWAPDVRRERKDLVAAFAGIAPFALVSALLVGVLLAEGISRPIRALAKRAEEISTERAGFSLLTPERDEVRRLTRSFDRMLEALSGSERQRVTAERIAAWQEVARRIAHEVKNPLSPIRLAVENLRRTREKAPEDLDRALLEETAVILEEVESLRRLVDEFSQFARLPSPQPVACDVRRILSQSLSLLAPRVQALGVGVATNVEDAPGRVVADPEQIGRVLKNVLSNALDALETAEERRLSVEMRRGGEETRPFLVIQVRDSGAGFEPEALRRVFEPYYTTRSERGGTGLGMAIAYRIVVEHGGAIEASGSRGLGATITIRLPVDGPPAARTQHA